MTYIISDAELAAARARYAQCQVKQQAPTPPPTTLSPGFVYQPRTELQWSNRAHQAETSFAPREFKPLKTSKTKAKAVTENTPCTCGHVHGCHDLARPSYPALKEVFAIGDS